MSYLLKRATTGGVESTWQQKRAKKENKDLEQQFSFLSSAATIN